LTITIGPLALHVSGPSWPAASDPHLVDTLSAEAVLTGLDSRVVVSYPDISRTLLASFAEQLRALDARQAEQALLDPMEPFLRCIVQACDTLGHLEVTAQLSADPMAESHEVRQRIDLSYLPGMIEQIERVVAGFPRRA